MADYDYLKASNGSGDAPLMHVASPGRIIGSSTLPVDTLVNVPTKFIASVGTLLANGTLDPADTINFKGHTSGANLIIDGFEPGSVDAANTTSQVVIIKPTSGWSNRVAKFIMNLTGFGTPEVLSFGDLTIGTLTADSVSINGAVMLSGASFNYTMSSTDLSNKYALVTFSHGLAYTPDVNGRVAITTSTPTSWDPLPFSYIKNKSYFGIPPSLTVAIQNVTSTGITVGIAIHDTDGTALLTAGTNKLQFEFYCAPFPGLNI